MVDLPLVASMGNRSLIVRLLWTVGAITGVGVMGVVLQSALLPLITELTDLLATGIR